MNRVIMKVPPKKTRRRAIVMNPPNWVSTPPFSCTRLPFSRGRVDLFFGARARRIVLLDFELVTAQGLFGPLRVRVFRRRVLLAGSFSLPPERARWSWA